MDFAYITVKLATGLVGLWVITRLLGRKEISQLTAFDFVSSLMLSEIVGNTIYDKEVRFIELVYALFLWAALSIALEKLVQYIPVLSRPLNGTADLIIKQGVIDFKALKRNNLDIDQLHTLLREQNVFTVREVAFAVFETNGNVSVMKKSAAEAIQREDLKLPAEPAAFPVVLIQKGRIDHAKLKEAGYDERWLSDKLQQQGVTSPEEVLYAEWMENKGLFIQTRGQ